MNNVQLFKYAIDKNIEIVKVLDVINYWYEWCFRKELYERLIKRYHLDNR